MTVGAYGAGYIIPDRRPVWVLLPNSYGLLLWDSMIRWLAVAFFIQIPIDIAYNMQERLPHWYYITIQVSIVFFFCFFFLVVIVHIPLVLWPTQASSLHFYLLRQAAPTCSGSLTQHLLLTSPELRAPELIASELTTPMFTNSSRQAASNVNYLDKDSAVSATQTRCTCGKLHSRTS